MSAKNLSSDRSKMTVYLGEIISLIKDYSGTSLCYCGSDKGFLGKYGHKFLVFLKLCGFLLTIKKLMVSHAKTHKIKIIDFKI